MRWMADIIHRLEKFLTRDPKLLELLHDAATEIKVLRDCACQPAKPPWIDVLPEPAFNDPPKYTSVVVPMKKPDGR